MRCLLAALALLLGTVGQASAAPKLYALYPTGGERGKTVVVTLSGENLKDITGFHSLTPGVTATILPGDNAGTRTAEIAIAPDAPPGIAVIRFFDATGVSNPRYFRVGTFPEVNETEPNDRPAQAKMVTLPATVNGRITQNPDRDCYTFHAKPGETIVCEVEGLRLLGMVSDSWLKGYMEIADATGKVLATSNGTADDYYRWDPLIAFTPPAEGDYTLSFRDLNWRGDIRAVYRLSLSRAPHATVLFPLGGKRGSTVSLVTNGPNCTDSPTLFTVPSIPDSSLLIAPNGVLNTRPFQLSDLTETLQVPGNNAREKAQKVPMETVVNGRTTAGKLDFYTFTVATKGTVQLEVFARRLGTPVDSEILLYNAQGGLMQSDDDGRSIEGRGGDSWILRQLDPGDYTVGIRDIYDRGGAEYAYRLWVCTPVPSLNVLTTPESPTVKRGEKTELTVRLTREYGWDADVAVTLENVPAGIIAAPLTIAKGQTEGKLTLSTAPNAPLGVVQLRIIATAKVGEHTVTALSKTTETYNNQGTAFQRELTGPLLFVRE